MYGEVSHVKRGTFSLSRILKYQIIASRFFSLLNSLKNFIFIPVTRFSSTFVRPALLFELYLGLFILGKVSFFSHWYFLYALLKSPRDLFFNVRSRVPTNRSMVDVISCRSNAVDFIERLS